MSENEAPKYLNCPWCNAQAFLSLTQTRHGLLRYVCPAKHYCFIVEEDPSFHHGYNDNIYIESRD